MERAMKNLLKRLIREDEGQDVIEYALLGAGISIVAIATIQLIGPAVDAIYVRINNALAAV
jgi:Flp pilus assembly pilin Flp